MLNSSQSRCLPIFPVFALQLLVYSDASCQSFRCYCMFICKLKISAQCVFCLLRFPSVGRCGKRGLCNLNRRPRLQPHGVHSDSLTCKWTFWPLGRPFSSANRWFSPSMLFESEGITSLSIQCFHGLPCAARGNAQEALKAASKAVATAKVAISMRPGRRGKE